MLEQIKLPVSTSVGMPLPVRATFLRAWERPSTVYYGNYCWGGEGGVEREKKVWNFQGG